MLSTGVGSGMVVGVGIAVGAKVGVGVSVAGISVDCTGVSSRVGAQASSVVDSNATHSIRFRPYLL